jgi:hypothetical protein
MIALGPILGFRGATATHWNVGVLLVTGQSHLPKVKCSVGTVSDPVVLKSHKGKITGLSQTVARKAVRFDLSIPLTKVEQIVRYEVDGKKFEFAVPGNGQPTRLAYTSCNGFSSASAAAGYTTEQEKNERWVHMLARHQGKDDLAKLAGEGGWKAGRFHLLLMGGDQVYADAIFETGEIKKWDTSWWQFWQPDKTKAPFTSKMSEETTNFYFNETYIARWSQPSVAAVFARVPTLMMWDDHDIFDGWGSREKKMQGCKVFKGIFGIASEHFEIFQRQTKPGEERPGIIPGARGFTWGFHIGNLAILAPDMRFERTQHQVVSIESWDAIYKWLDGLAAKPDRPTHLLFLSSIPVIYPSLRTVEAALAAIPGEQELEDDLRDHWCSRLHYGEQCRLVRRLFDFGKKANCRVTILSGDVHVAAYGRVTSILPEHSPDGTHPARINQLISSAIVHTPPNLAQAFFIEHVISGDPPVLESGLNAEMLEIPGTGSRLHAKRNWLDLALDEDSQKPRLWANWWFEGEDDAPATRVVHPIGTES